MGMHEKTTISTRERALSASDHNTPIMSPHKGTEEAESEKSSLQVSQHVQSDAYDDAGFGYQLNNHRGELHESSDDSQSYFKAAIHFQQVPTETPTLNKHYHTSLLQESNKSIAK